ncbi:hypothetical protein [Paenibacillus dokdonensis]|uniref:hypothetical protein n=1 Tax=Paenibacillus dokdonensis TaxID=2567944 RepID=UPI001457E4DB|nr:hypothetical protein [Paenibacillus dokdonensis]
MNNLMNGFRRLSPNQAISRLINEYEITFFSPEHEITRAEFVSLLGRSLSLAASTDGQPFADAPGKAWYASDVAAAQAVGIALGSDVPSSWQSDHESRSCEALRRFPF